jgi:hypothetical protein
LESKFEGEFQSSFGGFFLGNSPDEDKGVFQSSFCGFFWGNCQVPNVSIPSL